MRSARSTSVTHYADGSEHLIPTDFPGVSLRIGADRLTLRCDRPLRFIASTVAGGGIGRARDILALQVPRTFDCSNPATLLRRSAEVAGIDRRFIGFLTALDLTRAAVLQESSPRLLVVVTAGVTNAATPGRSAVAEPRPGTINVVALADLSLAPAALVAAVKVVTEAKTLALVEAGVRTADGGIATGTSTDAVAIGVTGEGTRLRYAGPVTAAGSALGSLVTEAVRISLRGGNVVR
jgi:adenosylcobinamide hydrolase